MASANTTAAPAVLVRMVSGMTSMAIRRTIRAPGSSGGPSISRANRCLGFKAPGRGKEGVVLLGQPHGDPGAVPGERSHQDLVVHAVLVERHRALAERQPEEVPLRLRDVVAHRAQFPVYARAFPDH